MRENQKHKQIRFVIVVLLIGVIVCGLVIHLYEDHKLKEQLLHKGFMVGIFLRSNLGEVHRLYI